MNEVRRRASGWVQRAASRLSSMIDGPGHSTGHLVIPRKEETIMLKTISAALLAVSVLAAPAFAATASKTAPAPVIKTAQVKPVKKAELIKPMKPSVRNANAHMGGHHMRRHHVRHAGHHRFHKHIGALKSHQYPKVSIKHVGSTTKRG
jgi:hypothetical protein